MNLKQVVALEDHHVCQDTWTPVIGEQLESRREDSNPCDRYSVAVVKGRDTVDAG